MSTATLRNVIFASAALVLVACGGGKADAPATDNTTPEAPAGKMPASGGQPVTLVEVSQGDMACYVVVKTAEGEDVTHPGTFDLCPGGEADASALVGTQVILTITKQNMMAGSCEGNPECPDTEEVDAVTAITAAR
jgi:hypothetical protein